MVILSMEVGLRNSSGSNKKLRIPACVRIGVTGHRTLASEQLIRESIKSVMGKLEEMLRLIPHTFMAVSPLAEGADRLVAKEILAWQVPENVDKPSLEAVLPLPEADYLQDFETRESRDEFRELLALAKSTHILDKAESRETAYENVGHFVVDNCDFLIAIWNGEPSKGKGGTAEIVEYACKIERYVFWINSENGTINEEKKGEKHIDHLLESLKYLDTYNNESLSDDKYISDLNAECDTLAKRADYFFNWDKIPGNDNVRLLEFLRERYNIGWATTAKIEKIDDDKTISIYSETNSISLILADDNTQVNLKIDNVRTDDFVAKMEGKEVNIYHSEKSGLKELFLKPLRDHLIPHYIRADLLALKYQKRHMLAGKLIYGLAAVAVAVATFYMIINIHELLIVEFVAVFVILLLLAGAYFYDWQRKWLDYRFLAERIRVGIFLCEACTDCQIPKPPPYLDNPHMQDDWTNRSFSWIWSKRSKEKTNIPFVYLKNFLRTAWIDDQTAYYEEASKRHGKSNRINTIFGEVLFALTILAVTLEISGLGVALTYSFIDGSKILTSLAIILPTASAAFAGIRFHQEYLRNAERYNHMARYLSTINEKMKQAQDMKELTEILKEAHEMMFLENWDWRVAFRLRKMEVP
jgi:hypothetical protein